LKILHENKCQGVLYEFREGARVWTERQKRFFVIGGELDGQMCTKYEVSQIKFGKYLRYMASGQGEHRNVWLYFQGIW
jgi:hypothetical protein